MTRNTVKNPTTFCIVGMLYIATIHIIIADTLLITFINLTSVSISPTFFPTIARLKNQIQEINIVAAVRHFLYPGIAKRTDSNNPNGQ
ncbi:hypothetical protein ACFCVU_00895 [Peribacillus butanolivorans]|uniref:hypothetical protein n=1 Tax=Peribacillus butanolivorans TaxID=421767 RepID=UPI0035D7CFCB